MCYFCRETANIADKLHEIVATQLILNYKTIQQTMTISLDTTGRLFNYQSPTSPRTAAKVHKKIYISGPNINPHSNQVFLIGFSFTYDTEAHTVCPYGTNATVLLNVAENPDNLLGYMEDEIINMIIGEASPKQQLKQVLAITRDKSTDGTRCQHIIDLYTSSHHFKNPAPGFTRIEVYQSHNKGEASWHYNRPRKEVEGIVFRELINEEGNE